jgi:hypothetical protein
MVRESFHALFLLTLPAALLAQVPIDTTRIDPESELERTLENATQDAEDSAQLEFLSDLLERPLDVNAATFEELTQIPGLTPMIAYNIMVRREAQRFTSLSQLLEVEGMTEDLFVRIRPFLHVETAGREPLALPFASARIRTRVVQDLQQRRGFIDGSFKGSPLKVYNRLTARSRTFGQKASLVEVGLLTEKDAGEQSLSDFVTGYVQADLRDYGTRLILGDFTVEAAEGLVFWRSIGFSKGAEVISTVKKGGAGIRPYRSTDENWYHRGVAVQMDFPILSVSGFYSSKPIHASVNANGEVTSFYTSGLFRTESELARRFTAHGTLFGGRISSTPLKGLKLGASAYRATFDRQVVLSGDFGFRGRTSSLLGLDAHFANSSVSLFSEVARAPTNSIAAIVGAQLEPVKDLELSIAARSYPRDFTSLYGYGFGESGNTQNESGVYAAARIRASRWLTLSSYFDQFIFPWKTPSAHFPSRGNDWLLSGDIRLSDRLSLLLQYRHKNKPVDEFSRDPLGRSVEVVGERAQTNYRATLEYRSSIAFRVRTRLEVVNVRYQYSSKVERGFLAFHDIRYYPIPNLLVDARIMAFETDSYDSRVYEFESDLRGTFANPALFGKGVRWYLLTRYELGGFIDLWLKYAQTIKEGVKEMSSGPSLIQGNLDNRISLQVDIVL